MRVSRKTTIRPPTHIDRAAQTAAGGNAGVMVSVREGWLWLVGN